MSNLLELGNQVVKIITHSNVSYIGTLYEINKEDKTLVLKDVICEKTQKYRDFGIF